MTFLYNNNKVSDCAGVFAVNTSATDTDIQPDTTPVTRTDTHGAIGGITTVGGAMTGTIRTYTTGTGGTDGAIGHIATTDSKFLRRL